MARTPKPKPEKKVTRYTYNEIKEPRRPETGPTSSHEALRYGEWLHDALAEVHTRAIRQGW